MQVQCHLGPGPVCIVALMAASLAISFTGPLCWAGLISKFQFPPSSRPQAFTWPLGLLMKLWPQRDPPLDSVSTQVGYRHYMFGSWLLYFPESYLWQAAYPEPHSSSSDDLEYSVLLTQLASSESAVSAIIFKNRGNSDSLCAKCWARRLT